ncbi:hypothetical protein Nepgr_020210 [Nepenthes gracilis]|uniref:Uncharacterized protein n=1 Tax=Nepenthes gracilis TaxID=150966 RepID=A0AAD3SWJ3_NEPGR|nr:hypothetical protein Nepgr_020210 [Nepenthes gracilis]
MLPKHRNRTLRLGCESSQLRHSCLAPSSLPPSPSTFSPISGPMQKIGGVRPPGTHSPFRHLDSEIQHVLIDLGFPIEHGHGHVIGRNRRHAGDIDVDIHILDALHGGPIDGGKVEGGGKGAGADREVVESGDSKLHGDLMGGGVKEVDDKCFNVGIFGDVLKSLLEVGVVEAGAVKDSDGRWEMRRRGERGVGR